MKVRSLAAARKELLDFLTEDKKYKKSELSLVELREHSFYKVLDIALNEDLRPFKRLLETSLWFTLNKNFKELKMPLDLLEKFCMYFYELGRFYESIS